MKNSLAVTLLLGAALLMSIPVFATGFVTMPVKGFVVTGGTTAYVSCNVSGNFGANPNGSTPPTFFPGAGDNNTCAVPSITPPLAGYAQVAKAIRNLTMTNTYTLNQPLIVGYVMDQVWRKGASCIYGSKIRLNNVDYDRRPGSPGMQYFEINDVVRGGFKNRQPISVAYYFSDTGAGQSDDVLYRAGLTGTSVVHKTGDAARPLTSLAPLSQNWINFSTDVSYEDDDGSSVRDSAWLLVKSSCTSTAPKALAGALKFRQMGQEDQPLMELSVTAYAPAGASTAP